MTFPIAFRALLVAALALSAMAACGKRVGGALAPRGPGGPVPVEIGEAVTKDMPVELRAIGNVESIATVEVKAQVGGELIEVNFREGQDVKRGDLLFTIQPRLYQVQLAQAEANLARDRAAAAGARRDADRNSELGTKGAISNERLDQLRTIAEAADAAVKADEALVEIARVRLGYTTIESPIDGRTGALNVQVGNLIKDNADQAMTTIKQLAPIYVTFAVPEQHLADIRGGLAARRLAVTALAPTSGRPLGAGALTFIANSVDATTGTITLKAAFPNEDRALWPGAFVDVVLHLDVEAGATVVPESAVTVGQRGQQVFVMKDDHSVELRTVSAGRTVAGEVVIKDGVRAGEKVVTNGQFRLVPGAKVLVKPAAEVKPARSTSNFQLPTFNAGSIAALPGLWTVKVLPVP